MALIVMHGRSFKIILCIFGEAGFNCSRLSRLSSPQAKISAIFAFSMAGKQFGNRFTFEDKYIQLRQ